MIYTRLTNQHPNFYFYVGPLLSRRAIVKQLGSPVWDDDGKIWVIAHIASLSEAVSISAITVKGTKAYLSSAYVIPAFRKQGIYLHLLDRRISVAREHRAHTITAVATEMSLHGLQSRGFAVRSRKGRFYRMEMALA